MEDHIVESDAEEARMIRQYLLSGLSEEEQNRIEERYFADADYCQFVNAVRDDLIDGYVRGELSQSEREQFLMRMKAPRLLEQIEFARALISKLDGESPAHAVVVPAASTLTSLWQYLLGAPRLSMLAASALMLVVMIGFWFATTSLWKSNQSEKQIAEKLLPETSIPETPRSENIQPPSKQKPLREIEHPNYPVAVAKEPKRVKLQSKMLIATLTLTANLVRGSGNAPELLIPRGADQVKLRIDVDENIYSSYRATLRTPEGKSIWYQNNIRARKTKEGQVVSLRIPAKVFRSLDYILDLSPTSAEGTDFSVSKYYFKANKK
jgi:hypothetical protein